MVPGVYTGYVVALAWISNSLPRPPAKRAAALAFINAISNTSSIYASYMYSAKDAPRYVIAMSVNCAMSAIAILAVRDFVAAFLRSTATKVEYLKLQMNQIALESYE